MHATEFTPPAMHKSKIKNMSQDTMVTGMTGISKDSVRKPSVEMCEFGQEFDVNAFKMQFNQFAKGYEEPMKQFHAYIVTFCVSAILMAVLMAYTLISVSLPGSNLDCQTNEDIVYFLIHRWLKEVAMTLL